MGNAAEKGFSNENPEVDRILGDLKKNEREVLAAKKNAAKAQQKVKMLQNKRWDLEIALKDAYKKALGKDKRPVCLRPNELDAAASKIEITEDSSLEVQFSEEYPL
ncbi:Oidioi.mRNA.OKI2018_I69.PAR.g10624.t1.cds [Oikopleura dioica]|uniref:Oidioi.mRNA.OKI2018_I69.PAR.g10624.t1.cds n=1 Tax=Oikopleura dioica TaxID=34765 RepID=A0ABN7RRF6_OIKDI|nr:Oidioi.mRNA.OKI2018_I69.PAR.g10624.t1.cds [Oikopleura dioica]